MPLPMMAGDPASMMQQPGMAPPAPSTAAPPPGVSPPGAPSPDPQGSAQVVDPAQQMRGAVELISQAKTAFASTMEGLASQFPASAKSANQAVLVMNQAMQAVVRDILQAMQNPEPAAPVTLH